MWTLIDERLLFAEFTTTPDAIEAGMLIRSRFGRGRVAKTEVHWGVYSGIPMLECLIEVAESTVADKSPVSHLEPSAKALLRWYSDPRRSGREAEIIDGLNDRATALLGRGRPQSEPGSTFNNFYEDNIELVLLVGAHIARWVSFRTPGLDDQTRLLRFMILNPRLPGSTEQEPVNIHPDVAMISTCGARSRLASDKEIVDIFEKETGFKVRGSDIVADVRRRLLKSHQYLHDLRTRMQRIGI